MNKILLTILSAIIIAQLIKIIIFYFKNKRLAWKDIFVTGGMPSSHSALVVSLTTIIYLTEGLTINTIIALVLALIVLRDAMGVRRTVGEETMLMNKIIKKINIKKELHYSMGHTPLQVLAGSLLGFLIATIIYFI